jgi:hypothetical protein
MKAITRGLVAGIVLAGAAVALAGPASADPTAGPYTATIIDPGASNKEGSVIWSMAECGSDCFRLLGTREIRCTTCAGRAMYGLGAARTVAPIR